MKKPVVAVDIDDVLSDHAKKFIEFSNSYYGLNNQVHDYSEDWPLMLNTSLEEVDKLLKGPYVKSVIHNLDHDKSSEEVLRKLKSKYEFIVITSRRNMIRGDTLAWLDKRYKGIFSYVHFAGIWDEMSDESKHMTKKEVALGVGANFLIDDQPKHCLAASEAGIHSILFGNYGWSKEVKPSKNLVKIHTWSEVGKYLWDYPV